MKAAASPCSRAGVCHTAAQTERAAEDEPGKVPTEEARGPQTHKIGIEPRLRNIRKEMEKVEISRYLGFVGDVEVTRGEGKRKSGLLRFLEHILLSVPTLCGAGMEHSK